VSISADEVENLNKTWSEAPVPLLLNYLSSRFGTQLAFLSSFQTQSVPLLHMVSRVCPNTDVIFLNTGFHFRETLEFRDDLAQRFGLTIVETEVLMGGRRFLQRYGRLHRSDPNLCCYLNKVEPLERALQPYKAWITGVRRDQTELRRSTRLFSLDAAGRLKVCPMLLWPSERVEEYIESHKLQRHPLSSKGYRSIGCQPCTTTCSAGEQERSGRWRGSSKTECGIHFTENGIKRIPK